MENCGSTYYDVNTGGMYGYSCCTELRLYARVVRSTLVLVEVTHELVS